jgi:hypothetical protein
MCIVTIGDSRRDRLCFVIRARSHPECTDYWDGNWLSSRISVVSGSFTGDISNVSLRVDEFQSFLKGIEILAKSLKGIAKYSSLEQWIQLELSGDGRGHIFATGFVIDKHTEGNKLNFFFCFDQTELSKTINGLRMLLDKYPIIGK